MSSAREPSTSADAALKPEPVSEASAPGFMARFPSAGPRFRPCDLCDEAFHGLIRHKIELEQRLENAQRNLDSAMRLYSQWRSRAEKAEADLSGRDHEERIAEASQANVPNQKGPAL